MLRSFFIVILAFTFADTAISQDKKLSKNANGVYKILYPDDIERSKHMRPEFLSSYNFFDPKRIKEDNDAKLSAQESRLNNIIRLREIITKYEAFPDINDWENAQILSTKAELASKEKRYQDAISYLIGAAQGGHVTSKTLGDLNYSKFQLYFKEKEFNSAQRALMTAFALEHPIMPWDFAILAEIAFRNNKLTDGVKLLNRAIAGLKANDCPVEPHWNKILQESSDGSVSDYIAKLLSSPNPWFTAPFPDTDISPIKRREPTYPIKALNRGHMGYTILTGIVNEKGTVTCSILVDGAGEVFVKPSQKAFHNFKYRPALQGGSPVWTYGIMNRFTFQMK